MSERGEGGPLLAGGQGQVDTGGGIAVMIKIWVL